MKIILQLILVIMIIFSPLEIFAYWDFEFEDIYYKVSDTSAKTLEVVKPKLREGTISIPSVVNYNGQEYKVTKIGYRAFASCSKLMAVTLSEGILIIEHSAFRDCENLVSVKLPKSLQEIGYDAFMDCENLRSITIGENVSKIGIQSFYRCKNLEKLTLECSNAKIELRAFGDCKSLNLINIKSIIPPNINFDSFANVEKDIEVLVNKKSLSKFKKDKNWNKFTNIKGVK